MSPRVLLIEDEPGLVMTISDLLAEEGLSVESAGDGKTGLTRALETPFDVIILDVMLPGLSGLEVCRQLRQHGRDVAILMVTAKTQVVDRVVGLKLGADDYLTKPFSLAELMARVKALLRRADLQRAAQVDALAQPTRVRNGDLEIAPAKRQVRYRGAVLDFTALEFDLLVYFALHPGHVYSRAQLLGAVWGYTHDGYEHTVTTHINRLRAKLEADPMRPELILTVRGAGYKMREAPG